MNIQFPHILDNPQPAAVRAGGSSFYFAMRILGREQRKAMFEIYSFCRAVDDIADGDAPRDRRRALLASWRESIEAVYAGANPHGLDGLTHAIRRFELRKDDFLAVIDGMEMDASSDMCAPDLDELDLYCDRVASAVGRLSVRVFGMDDAAGKGLAHHLGRALQLTNILRDLDEDAACRRLYLPKEALRSAGIRDVDPRTVVADPNLDFACEFVADRARAHFDQADAIMARCPRRLVRAPKVMAEVYAHMLEGMSGRGWAAPRERVRINKSHLLWIALRHVFV